MRKTSMKTLFTSLLAYVVLYGLLCSIILIYAPSPALRLAALMLATAAVLARAVWILNHHADVIEAWGKKTLEALPSKQ